MSFSAEAEIGGAPDSTVSAAGDYGPRRGGSMTAEQRTTELRRAAVGMAWLIGPMVVELEREA